MTSTYLLPTLYHSPTFFVRTSVGPNPQHLRENSEQAPSKDRSNMGEEWSEIGKS